MKIIGSVWTESTAKDDRFRHRCSVYGLKKLATKADVNYSHLCRWLNMRAGFGMGAFNRIQKVLKSERREK